MSILNLAWNINDDDEPVFSEPLYAAYIWKFFSTVKTD